MAFKLVVPLNSVNNRSLAKASATVTTLGQILIYDGSTGNVVGATAATLAPNVMWTSNQSIATLVSTTVLGTEIRPSDIYQVDTINNTSANHNGQRMLIDATGLLLNNTGTDAPTGPFEQIAVVGAAAGKQILAKKVG